MSADIDWDWKADRRAHIENRKVRDGSDNIVLEWTQEAWDDPDRLFYDPDPRGRAGSHTIRCVGYSPTGQRVITVIAMRIGGQLYGLTAYTTSGRDLRNYLEGDQ